MNKINTILDITTLLANIVTIGGISYAIYAIYIYLKQSEKIKIYFDETLNMLTSPKVLERVLMRLIKYPEKIHILNIITKTKKQKRHNNIPFAVVEKRNALLNTEKVLLIKRGITIIIYEVIHDSCTFNSTLVNSLSNFVANYNIFVKNLEHRLDGDGKVLKVTTRIGELDLSAKIVVSKDIASSVQKNIIINGLPGQRNCDFNIIEDPDNAIKLQVMYDFIVYLSRDKFWDGENFLHNDKLMWIFKSSEWYVGEA